MISVVIPVYNAEPYIAATLDSILGQSFQRFEIIVADDGSTDGTVAIVQQYMARDSRIQLIQNRRLRQSKARNTAIASARFPWIAPVDADDLLMPKRFERQLAYAEAQPDVVAWGTYSTLITSAGEAYNERRDRPTTLEEFQALRQQGALITMPNSSCLLRKDIVEAIGGYDSRFDGLEDIEILLRMADYGPILVVPEFLIYYRMHAASTTGSLHSFREQRKHFKYLEEQQRRRLRGQNLQLDAFLDDYDSCATGRRLLRYIDDLSAFQLKNAALAYGEKRYWRLLRAMAASLALNPYYVIHRFLHRFVLRREFSNYRV